MKNNSYKPNKHDTYIECLKCNRKNAPQNSSEYSKYCFNCNVELPKTGNNPIEEGEVYIIEIDDMHENGSGIGRTDNGFIIMVEGYVPGQTVKVEISNVKNSYAVGEVIEEDPEIENKHKKAEKDEEEDDTDGKQEDPILGKRDNYWG